MIESAPQPSGFTATYTISVTGIKTKTVGDLTDVVCSVNWTLRGVENGQSFEVYEVTLLDDPNPDSFQSLNSLNEDIVVAWIESTETRLPSIKYHVQNEIAAILAKPTLDEPGLPWAPV